MRLVAALVCAFTLRVARADQLGSLHVTLTGSAPARAAFRRGLLALHSFWYEQAKDDFDAAARLDPNMALAHWGAAQTYIHLQWQDENLSGCREELAKINHAKGSFERALIDSTRALCGDGERADRWHRYASILHDARLAQPREEELAALEAVALLGVAYGVEHGSVHRRMEAGAIALELLARNPNHPGAAHYAIHAFDDPDHAILALPAARRYAQIAPAAYHARHMPSHIFVQLGMWEDAASSNESAWTASVEQATKHYRDTSWYDFHSLEWLMQIRLELGQEQRAMETLQRGLAAYSRSNDPGNMPLILGMLGESYMEQTQAWSRADELLAPLRDVVVALKKSQDIERGPSCPGHRETRLAERALDADFLWARGHALAAIGLHDAKTARARLADARVPLEKMTQKNADDWRPSIAVIEGALAALDGNEDVLEKALRAQLAEEHKGDDRPAGPAGGLTTRERLGALLLDTKRPQEALALYREELARRPRRSTSLLGAARAARAASDQSALAYYRALADLWKDADDSPELREARAAR